jgi:hypothetical protein
MSVWSLFFPVVTVILSALCFVCYKTNKPLRDKAKAEAKEKELKELKEAQDAFAKEARDDFRKKVYSDIEQALATPDRDLLDLRYGSGSRGKYRWAAFAELALFMKDHRSHKSESLDVQSRLDAQAKTIRDLKGQINEIHRLLKPYA